MPRNGSGTYTLPEPAFVAGTVISSAAVNDDLSDIATALTGSLPRDGQAAMTGQLKSTDGSLLLPGFAFSNDLNTGIYRPGDDQLSIVVGGVQVGLFTSGGLQGVLPVGCILDYAGATTPSLFILCYGQNISRTTYALLFAAIGTTYGAGDGSTTFGLPDLRGRATFGKDNMGGVAAGALTTTYYTTNPTTLGAYGGQQQNQLITSNLPAYTPTGGISISDSGHLHTVPLVNSGQLVTSGSGSAGQGVVPNPTNTGTAFTGIGATFIGNSQGGSSLAFTNVAPGMITNKIIYAGA